MLTRPGSGRDTMIPVLLLGCVDVHSRCPSMGFAHSCSLAAMVAARIGDIRPGTLRFSPTVRGTIRLWPGRSLLKRRTSPAERRLSPPRASSRRRMPSRASHPANPQQVLLPNQRLLSKDPNITHNEVARWRYTELLHALGCNGWLTAAGSPPAASSTRRLRFSASARRRCSAGKGHGTRG